MRLLQPRLAALRAVAGDELPLGLQTLDQGALVGMVAQLGVDGGLFRGAHVVEFCTLGASAPFESECLVALRPDTRWPTQMGTLRQNGAAR